MMRKMMTPYSVQMIKVLIAVDMILAVFALIFFDGHILWSTQIGFISASLVMLGSMKSYQRMIDTRVEHHIVSIDDSKDMIDKLEDPYDLYSEVLIEEEKPLVDVVKEERKRLKANARTFSQTLKDTRASVSLYRLGAYVVLILGFLYLHRHALLHIPSYILSLGLPTLIIVYILLSNKEKQTQD